MGVTWVQFEKGDVVLTRGSSWISRSIRKFTRSKGESDTKVNHVGIVVEGGSAQNAMLVEALGKGVKRGYLWRYAGVSDEIAVFRRVGLSDDDRGLLMARTRAYEGRAYGYLKLVTQWLDWAVGNRYIFRRLTRMDNFPICSWLVANAYEDIGVSFGVPADAATPDDIWDHVVSSPEWEEVHPLGRLTGWL